MSLTERVHPTPPPNVAKKADAVEMTRRHLKPPPDAPSSANTSEISQPVTPLQRVSRPTSAADTSTKSQERNSSKKRKHHHKCGLGGESTKHLYQWRLLGIAAIITTSVATVLLVLAFNLEQWEIISYTEDKVQSLSETFGVATETHPSYFILRHSITGGDNTTTQTSLAISRTLITGILGYCDTVEDDLKASLMADGVVWLTQDCHNYTLSGESEFRRNTPEYNRQHLSRYTVACMVVSTVCLTSTLFLGLFSFIGGQVVLCIVTSTLCLAAALYQMFTGLMMWKRMTHAPSPLQHDLLGSEIPIQLTESQMGQSLIYTLIATVFAVIAGVLWIFVYHILRKDIKVLEKENLSGTYNFNICCSHVM